MVRNKSVDFCFLLGGISFPIMTGGDKVIAVLANSLVNEGYNVCVAQIKDNKSFIPDYKLFKYLLNKQKRRYSSGIKMLLRHFYELSVNDLTYKIIFKKLGKFDKKYAFNNKIKIITRINNLPNIKNLIITTWLAAYPALSIKAESKYYFIQNSEDDESYSGYLSSYAKKTYDFKFNKIVINEKEYERFKDDKPTKILVGFDPKYKIKNPIEKRDKKNVLFPLRTSESKGAIYMIKAAEILHSLDNEIKFSSFGAYKGEVPNFINHYGVITDEKLIDLYNSSSIFVLPSIIEGLPLTPLEAMHCGCAAVLTNCKGTMEFAKDGKNSLVVPIKDPNAIVKAVKRILDDDNLRINLAEEGLKSSENFTYARMVEQFKKAILVNNI